MIEEQNNQPMDEATFRQACEELADAMEKGAALTLPLLHLFYPLELKEQEQITEACAIGAAAVGKSGTTVYQERLHPTEFDEYLVLFPVLEVEVLPPDDFPEDGVYARGVRPLYSMILILNDHLKWTRERIAAWIRVARRPAPEGE